MNEDQQLTPVKANVPTSEYGTHSNILMPKSGPTHSHIHSMLASKARIAKNMKDKKDERKKIFQIPISGGGVTAETILV